MRTSVDQKLSFAPLDNNGHRLLSEHSGSQHSLYMPLCREGDPVQVSARDVLHLDAAWPCWEGCEAGLYAVSTRITCALANRKHRRTVALLSQMRNIVHILAHPQAAFSAI